MKFAAIAVVVVLLAVVIALAEVARRTRVPYPTLMVVAGLLIGFIPGLPTITLDPDLVFLVFLPPILYAAAWNTWLHDFRRHAVSISLLAIGLVFFTALAVAWVICTLIPGMPWWVGFLLGAIVSPPDAAAATAIGHRLGVSRRIVTLLEGESLVNDASGLILYRVAVAAVVAGEFSPLHAGRDLLVAAVGGVLIGLAVGWVVARAHRIVREPTATTALSLIAAYAAYLPAEHFHCSGVLATVAAGLYVSRKSPEIFSPAARLRAVGVWEVLILIVNGVLFVVIGLQLKSVVENSGNHSPWMLAWYAIAVSLTVLLSRVAWVFPVAPLARFCTPRRWREPRLPWQMLTVVSWTGMRGVVSLAAAMALPLDVQYRDLLILLTFAVIFATLVIQSLTLPPLIRALGEPVADVIEHEELIARLVMADAALRHLESGGDPALPVLIRVREDYLNRVELASAEVRGDDHPRSRGRARPEDSVRHGALGAERAALVGLRDRGEISEEVFRRIERDVDLEDARLSL